MTRAVKKWTTRDAAKSIITPSDLDHKYSRGVLGGASAGASINAEAIITAIPETLANLLKR
jgi:hypothetical protein